MNNTINDNNNDDDDAALFVLSPTVSNDDDDNTNTITLLNDNLNNDGKLDTELAIIANDIDDLIHIEEKLHPEVKLVEDNDSYYIDAESTDQRYIHDARNALSVNDLRLCMILLRHIKTQTNESLDVLIECAYKFWKSLSPLFVITNGNDSDSDKQLKVDEYDEIKKIVKEAYTTLLGGPLRHKVHAYEYCKLSHIYIAEGSLLGNHSLLILLL